MRIGVPDYNNPKDKPYLMKGKDPRYPDHITLTHYELMKRIVDESQFTRYNLYHYWNGDNYIYGKIDYSLGMVKRTPDNDSLCKRVGLARVISGSLQDVFFILSKCFVVQEEELLSRPGRSLHVTSLVVDLFK